jgi:hypothetical protein
MMVLVPREIFGNKVGRYTNKRRAALWRPENVDSFIFCKTKALIRPCSWRIQAMVSNRRLHCPLRHIRRARIQIRLGTRQIINSSVGGGIRRAWSLWSSYRQFIRLLPRQLFGLGCFTGIPHRRRHLRLRTSGRAFLRRLRRLSGLDRGILCWVDSHLHRHLAVVAEIGTRAGHSRCRHLDVAAAITAPRARCSLCVSGWNYSEPRSSNVLLRVLAISA